MSTEEMFSDEMDFNESFPEVINYIHQYIFLCNDAMAILLMRKLYIAVTSNSLNMNENLLYGPGKSIQ